MSWHCIMRTMVEGMAAQYVLLVLVAAVRCDRCWDDLTTLRNTTLFNQQTYKTLRPLSLYECAAECRGSKACSSIYFERDTETCNLNTNGSSSVDNASRPDAMYSERKHWPKSISGPCFHSTCAIGSKCEGDRFGRTLCAPDVKDCGEPPELPDANKLTDHHLQGGRTTYTCKPDFVACDASSMAILCQPSGSWEVIDSFCRRFRWTSVGASSYDLPCGASGGINITLHATPTKPTRTVIILTNGRFKLIKLRFSFRWNKLLIKTQFEHWRKVFNFPMPLTVGQKSEIIISLYKGVYKIQVDGKHICTFPERKIGAKPDQIHVKGDVEIQLLEIRYFNREGS